MHTHNALEPAATLILRSRCGWGSGTFPCTPHWHASHTAGTGRERDWPGQRGVSTLQTAASKIRVPDWHLHGTNRDSKQWSWKRILLYVGTVPVEPSSHEQMLWLQTYTTIVSFYPLFTCRATLPHPMPIPPIVPLSLWTGPIPSWLPTVIAAYIAAIISLIDSKQRDLAVMAMHKLGNVMHNSHNSSE